jgi:prepilin-type N-terminal cleavage/methylation domain-containing protein
MRFRRCAAAAGRRLASERGYSLSEMLVVLAILGIVLGALTQLFVSASTAQVDMTKRFQAQQQARLALDKLRREIHCASAVTSTDPVGWPSASIKITLGSYCLTGSGEVTWCTRASSTPGAWALYRISPASGTCTGGVKWADYLSNLMVPNGRIFGHPTLVPGNLDTLSVNLPVDLTPNDAKQRYVLQDDIVLRNTPRS